MTNKELPLKAISHPSSPHLVKKKERLPLPLHSSRHPWSLFFIIVGNCYEWGISFNKGNVSVYNNQCFHLQGNFPKITNWTTLRKFWIADNQSITENQIKVKNYGKSNLKNLILVLLTYKISETHSQMLQHQRALGMTTYPISF